MPCGATSVADHAERLLAANVSLAAAGVLPAVADLVAGELARLGPASVLGSLVLRLLLNVLFQVVETGVQLHAQRTLTEASGSLARQLGASCVSFSPLRLIQVASPFF